MIASSIAVVVEINAARLAGFAVPDEYQPPLLVHSDGMESLEIAAQLLKVATGRRSR